MSNYDQDTLVLILPLPPSLNSYYKYTSPVAHKVIKYVSEAGKNYRKLVQSYVELNNFDIQANIPLTVEIIINFASNRQQDLDNRCKCLLDSLTHANVYQDDSLIYDLHLIRGTVKKPGSVIVKISEYKDV